MHSLVYKPTGEERLWQGGEAWRSRDVVIFPVIGHAAPFEVCGDTYELKSHGLARYARLHAVREGESRLTLSFSSDEQTLKSYPFEFDFSVSYGLEKNSVAVTYFVRSKGGAMPFYVGGHPGMYAPGGSAVIEFENEEHPVIYPLEGGAAAMPRLKRFVADKAFFAECKTFQLGGLSGGAVYARTAARAGLRGNRADPMPEKDLYVLRKTSMPAVLGEFGFMDSRTDTPVILTEEFADNVARGIVEALAGVLRLEEREMTDEKFDELMQRWLAAQAARPATMPEHVARAVALGITTGEEPCGIPTREQVMTMVANAIRTK